MHDTFKKRHFTGDTQPTLLCGVKRNDFKALLNLHSNNSYDLTQSEN